MKEVSNDAQLYSEVPLFNWVNGYYAESKEPNYADNLIYTPCLEVIYEYQYFKNDSIKYFNQKPYGEWSFINQNELDRGIGSNR